MWGDIKVAALLIDEGGILRGQCIMRGGDGESEPLLIEGPQEAAVAEEPAPTEPEAPGA